MPEDLSSSLVLWLSNSILLSLTLPSSPSTPLFSLSLPDILPPFSLFITYIIPTFALSISSPLSLSLHLTLALALSQC